MAPIRVLLVDDHAIVRDGLRTAINAEPDLKVVAEAGSGFEAVQVARRLAADVACMDLSMPGMSGTQAIQQLRRESPTTRVLVLSMHDDPAYLRAAVAVGCDGYLLKSTPIAQFVEAIRLVAQGRQVFDKRLEGTLNESNCPPRRANAPGAATDPTERLSARESDVLRLLVQGFTHREIADRLFLSVKTVETYRARIKEKIGLQTRADFVRYGLECGLLRPDGSKE